MASTSSRTLRLLSLLQGQRYWPGAELAVRLEVSPRTLRRDVDRLRELGYPVQAHRGVDGGYQLAAGAALPPLVLDDEEAVALAVGLHAATDSAVAGTAEASARALSKVVQVMPPRLRRQVEALRGATDAGRWAPAGEQVDPVVLTTVARACRDSERLELSYTAVDGARTERRVEPHRLVSLGRRWYLVAYDLGRQDWRSLRLDRLTAPRGDRTRFRPREVPGGDAAAFVQQRIRQFDATYAVSAVVHRPVAEVPGRIGRWVELTDLPGGRCRLRMTTDTLDWAALALGTCGAELSEVEPPALAALLEEWAGRFVRATSPVRG